MSLKTGLFGFALGSKSAGSKTATASAPVREQEQKTKPRQLPPFNVVLLNDDEHTYEYVIQLLKAVFAYPEEKGQVLAKAVDLQKRAIVYTAHRELAELKREQIQSFGADQRVLSCKGSMSAVIEPA
jgi:ATP-dependent Clp protease adaptor protein ClpS